MKMIMPSTIQEAVTALPFGPLHLKLRTAKLLEERGATTIGHLLELVSTNFVTMRVLSPTAVKDAKEVTERFLNCIDEKGEANWFQFWERSKITILPTGHRLHDSPLRMLKALPKIIKEILDHENDSDKHWRTIQRRFGLEGKEVKTLEEIGQAFGGLTRERVRQIERDGLAELREVLLENRYAGKKYHVHPEITTLIKALFETVASNAKDFVLETELLQIAESVVGERLNLPLSTLNLLFTLFGLSQIEIETYESTPIWGHGKTEQRDVLASAIRLIDDLLTREQIEPMEEFDILIRVNSHLSKARKIDALQLHRFLELCGSIEKRPDGLFQGKFTYLKTRANQAERILAEAKEPLQVNEIARQMNARLVNAGKKKIKALNIGNIMSSDERFISIGSSGLRGLKKWENLESGNILDLMEEALIRLNRPATEEEIYQFVSERRPVKLGSIKIYLSSKNIFAKAGYQKWGLASWVETQDALIWSPTQVADFVASIFKERKAREIEYKILTQALMEAAKVTNSQARGLLVHNPVVSSRRELKPFKIFAVFNPDYKNELSASKSKFQRKTETQFQKAVKAVREIFESEPSKQIALSTLRKALQTKNNLPKQSAYQYIARMNFLKKVDLPETHTRVCRIEGTDNYSFPQLIKLNSYDKGKAEEASKAIEKLTLEDVDMGLFILGRLFENTLKDFMTTAERLKAYSVGPNNYGKLNNMIQWLDSQGIVSDKTALNFLRHERNDRAHGKAPSVEERRIMLQSAPWVSSLYLNYIVFFEEQSKLLS